MAHETISSKTIAHKTTNHSWVKHWSLNYWPLVTKNYWSLLVTKLLVTKLTGNCLPLPESASWLEPQTMATSNFPQSGVQVHPTAQLDTGSTAIEVGHLDNFKSHLPSLVTSTVCISDLHCVHWQGLPAGNDIKPKLILQPFKNPQFGKLIGKLVAT